MIMETIKSLRDSKIARWTALAIVSFTMMFGYFFTDVMSPLEPLLTLAKDQGGLGWSSDDYGFFSGSYGFFNVFLLMLFFGGIILDKFGIRFTGVMSTVLMFVGALIKWYAVGHEFEGHLFGYQMQVVWACLGFAIFGVGCEIAGITVSKILVKWFTGYELALAMGLQVALARVGTAGALAFSLPFAEKMGGVPSSVGLGVAMLCIGMISYLVYCVMDKKLDASYASDEKPEEGFKMSDLKLIFTSKGFWLIAVLCLMFYAGVFPFLKFATKLMISKYGVPSELAGLIPAMLPFGTIILTPLFGSLYDRIGKGATLMIIGSVLMTFVHVVFALPGVNAWWLAVAVIIVLGVAFGLVPSAMWPSVPKIIPMQLLGSAYALIFYIQNIGLSLVPIMIGKVNEANTVDGVTNYTPSMAIFAMFGVVAIVIACLLKREDARKGFGLEKPNLDK